MQLCESNCVAGEKFVSSDLLSASIFPDKEQKLNSHLWNVAV
jgi:hypothetical protein